MSRFIRCFLACLLMLTLPFQGVAAAAMAMSMASDEAGMAMQHEGMAGMNGVQAPACHDQMPGMSAVQADQQPVQEHGTPAKFKVCGNCCVGVMLGALQAPAALLPVAGDVYASWPDLDPEGVIPEGLERPPRQIS